MLLAYAAFGLAQPQSAPKPIEVERISEMVKAAKTACPAAMTAAITQKGDPASIMMEGVRGPEEMLVMLELCSIWNAAYLQGGKEERGRAKK